jgi:hypothetical protein
MIDLKSALDPHNLALDSCGAWSSGYSARVAKYCGEQYSCPVAVKANCH